MKYYLYISLLIPLVFNPRIQEGSVDLHPFYVSVTEVAYNDKAHSLEISAKIFIDDLENTLKKNYQGKIDLSSPASKTEMNKLLTDYFKKHLQIRADGKLYTARFLGYEKEAESAWSYLEIAGVPSAPKKLQLVNTILYDYTDQQINMMHVTVKGKRQSSKLNYPDSLITFSF